MVALAWCAGCANPDSIASTEGGSGTTTTTSPGTTTEDTTSESCTKLPTGLHEVGPGVEIVPVTVFDTPNIGEYPAVASNGTVHLAVWNRNARIFGTRLDDEGTPLDVPARLLSSSDGAFGPAVTWNGSHFVVVWNAVLEGIRVMLVAADGTPADPAGVELVAADDGAQEISVAQGDVTLVTWAVSQGGPVRALRLGPDGASLDAAPIVISEGPARLPQVLWNGSNFVVAWYDGATGEARAARLTPEGTVLDPGGVLLAAGAGLPAIVADGADTIVAWIEESTWLYAARLSPTLEALSPAPVLVAQANPLKYESYTGVRLSRSADGGLAVGWIMESDAGSVNPARALAIDPQSLAPMGTDVSVDLNYGSPEQAFLGLAGGDHLVVRAGIELHAARLSGSPQGLQAGDDHPIFLGPARQEQPVVASNGDGYLAVWQEGGFDLKKVLARPLATDGTPTGEPFQVVEPVVYGYPYHLASAGADYLFAWKSAELSFDLLRISPENGVLETITIAEGPELVGTAFGCASSSCLAVYTKRVDQEDSIYGVRVAPDGKPIDAEPVLLSKAEFPDGSGVLVRVAGDAFHVLWGSGAVRVTTDGKVEETPAFKTNEGPLEHYLAGSPNSLLSWRSNPNVAGAGDLVVRDLNGKTKGKYALPDHLPFPPSAGWDGSAYLFASPDHRLFALKEDGTLDGPEEGVEVARASEHALALQSPGRTLRVATQLVFEYAAPRLIAQPITRADADVCDP